MTSRYHESLYNPNIQGNQQENQEISGSLSNDTPHTSHLNKNFIKSVHSKLEFAENHTKKHENIDIKAMSDEKCNTQASSSLLPQQKLLGAFLGPNTPYNAMLIYHGTGTGKTCTAVTIAESYKEYVKEQNKKIIVISSKVLQDNFRKTIYNPTEAFQCTGYTYLDTLGAPEVISNKIKKNIDSTYEFFTYFDFAKHVKNKFKISDVEKLTPTQQKQIKEYYTDAVIIIDECQNLRDVHIGNITILEAPKLIMKMLEHVTTHAVNLKLVLLSATPMYDKPNEIIWLLNLLLRVYKQDLLPDDTLDKYGVISPKYKKHFEEAIHGKVSFLRGENPFTFPFKLTNREAVLEQLPAYDLKMREIKDDEKIRINPLTTSELSYEHTAKILNKRELLQKNFYNEQLQLHNICWNFSKEANIKDCIGRDGMSSFFSENNDVFTLRNNVTNPFDDLKKYSAKFDRILRYLEKSTGVVVVYSKFVTSGAIPFALLLEMNGYTKFNKHGGHISHLKSNSKKANKKNNYAIFTANESYSGNKKKLLEYFNSPENKNGNVIKVLILTPVGGEGITLKNVRELHIVEPNFNMGDINQTVGRVIRTCSHNELPFEQRNCIVYFHASLYNKGYQKTHEDHESESVDIHLFRKAEMKQKAVAEIEKIIETNAFDCAMLHNINFFDSKIFQPQIATIIDSQNHHRQYTLGTSAEKEIDCKYSFTHTKPLSDTTYIPFERDALIAERLIQNIFKKYNTVGLSDIEDIIQEKFEGLNKQTLYSALNKLIINRVQFENMFHVSGNIKYSHETRKYHFVTEHNSNEFGDYIVPFQQPKYYHNKYVYLDEVLFPEAQTQEKAVINTYSQSEDALISKYLLVIEIFNKYYFPGDATKKYDTRVCMKMVVDKLSHNDKKMIIEEHVKNPENQQFRISIPNTPEKVDFKDAFKTYVKHQNDKTYIYSIKKAYIDQEEKKKKYFIEYEVNQTEKIKQREIQQNDFSKSVDFIGYIHGTHGDDFSFYIKKNIKATKGLNPLFSKKDDIITLIKTLDNTLGTFIEQNEIFKKAKKNVLVTLLEYTCRMNKTFLGFDL